MKSKRASVQVMLRAQTLKGMTTDVADIFECRTPMMGILWDKFQKAIILFDHSSSSSSCPPPHSVAFLT